MLSSDHSNIDGPPLAVKCVRKFGSAFGGEVTSLCVRVSVSVCVCVCVCVYTLDGFCTYSHHNKKVHSEVCQYLIEQVANKWDT